jgi:hypothetical protein
LSRQTSIIGSEVDAAFPWLTKVILPGKLGIRNLKTSIASLSLCPDLNR